MRPSRDQNLMDVALAISMRGTCERLQVGAVFSKEGRIISTGYNGAPRGLGHCSHDCTCTQLGRNGEHLKSCPVVSPCTIAQHAERNGIDFAARYGLSLEGSELAVTHSPCAICAGSLLNVGVVKVSFLYPYRLPDGVDLLRSASIEVVDLSLGAMVE